MLEGSAAGGPSGIGGDDGYVYLFSNVGGSILLARVSAAKVADRGFVSCVPPKAPRKC